MHRWDDLYHQWIRGMRRHLVQYSTRAGTFVRVREGELGEVIR